MASFDVPLRPSPEGTWERYGIPSSDGLLAETIKPRELVQRPHKCVMLLKRVKLKISVKMRQVQCKILAIKRFKFKWILHHCNTIIAIQLHVEILNKMH
jgi:hypothetical protein